MEKCEFSLEFVAPLGSDILKSLPLKFMQSTKNDIKRIFKLCSLQFDINIDIVECRHNAVQFNVILYILLRRLGQNINVNLIQQNTPHSSPWRTSYRVPLWGFWRKSAALLRRPLYMQADLTVVCCWRQQNNKYRQVSNIRRTFVGN